MPVRRLLPDTLAEMDQQAILAMASYCNHFTGMTIYLLGRRHLSECWSR